MKAKPSAASVKSGKGVKITDQVTIDRPAEELYDFWRKLENLPLFMGHIRTVKEIDGTRSHWTAEGPQGKVLEWDAEIINDHSPYLISWRSTEASDLDHAGAVRFEPAPGGRGTVVSMNFEYMPPGGTLGKALAKLLGEDPKQEIHQDLRRFKSLMEAGEIPTVQGQPVGSND